MHGDERGSVDRFHNQRGEALLEPDERLQNYRRKLLQSAPLYFNDAAREIVTETIEEVASHRGWVIQELNVLSDHVHVVVTAPEKVKPEKIISDFKAWSTRRLRERGIIAADAPVWEHHGSTRYLYDARAVEAACAYVRNQNEPRA